MNERRIARELLVIADELLPRAKIIFPRVAEVDSRAYNEIHFEIQRCIDRIRANETLEVVVRRHDTPTSMTLAIEFSDHEAKEAISREVVLLAVKLAVRVGLKTIMVEQTLVHCL